MDNPEQGKSRPLLPKDRSAVVQIPPIRIIESWYDSPTDFEVALERFELAPSLVEYERLSAYVFTRTVQRGDMSLDDQLRTAEIAEAAKALPLSKQIVPKIIGTAYNITPWPPKVLSMLLRWVKMAPQLDQKIPPMTLDLKEDLVPLINKMTLRFGGEFRLAFEEVAERITFLPLDHPQGGMTLSVHDTKPVAFVKYADDIPSGRRYIHELAHLINLEVARNSNPPETYRPTDFTSETIAASLEHIYYNILITAARDYPDMRSRAVYQYCVYIWNAFVTSVIFARANYEWSKRTRADGDETLWVPQIHKNLCLWGGVELTEKELFTEHWKDRTLHANANYAAATAIGFHVACNVWEGTNDFRRGFNNALAAGSDTSPSSILARCGVNIHQRGNLVDIMTAFNTMFTSLVSKFL
ncbi:MAG: hypothetical protein ACE5GA_00130 [Candidatus Zixiibacteriota bacterium]